MYTWLETTIHGRQLALSNLYAQVRICMTEAKNQKQITAKKIYKKISLKITNKIVVVRIFEAGATDRGRCHHRRRMLTPERVAHV
jgi:hypothetical protein